MNIRRLCRLPTRVSGKARQASFATSRPARCDPGEKLKLSSNSFSVSTLVSNIALKHRGLDLGSAEEPILKILAFRAVRRPVTNLLPARSQNDLELLVIRPASTPAGFDNSQPFNPSTVLIVVHKDCHAALTLIDRAALTERKHYYWHPLSRDDHRLAKTDKKVEPEPAGQPRPHPAPAKDVAVDDVEGIIARNPGCCGPFQTAGQITLRRSYR